MADTSFNNKTANLWTSRIIPLILVGIVGYVTWVVIVLLCANYLLYPPARLPAPRHGAGIAILVLYSILLLLMGLAYLRLVYTVITNPGYVPRSPQWHSKQERNARVKRIHRKGHETIEAQSHPEKHKDSGSPNNGGNRRFAGGAYTEGTFDAPTTTEPAPGLQDFYNRDVFTELITVVKLSDAVGGVVSETSFKFFIQFVGWGALYCLFNLVVMAYFLAEYRKRTHDLHVHWLVTLCCGALFGLFAVGMTGSSLQFAIINSTTIENLSRKTTVWTLAIYMPNPTQNSSGFRTISFSSAESLSNSQASSNQDPSDRIRTFAILHTKPGENPFDLGPYRNFKSVMGDHWYDWFLPFKYSPCCNHDRQDGQFAMGPVVDRLRKDAGITIPSNIDNQKQHKRRRRRRRHRYDVSAPGQPVLEKLNVSNENPAADVDLESGLGGMNR